MAVMYLGRLCEIAPSDVLYQAPAHHYTAALLASAVEPDPESARTSVPLSGEPPSPINPPSGCRFRPPTACPVSRGEVEPWLSVKPVTALITAEKFGGAAHGVDVCCGLVHEARQPGDEEEAAHGECDERGPGRILGPSPPAVAHDGDHEPDADHGHQVERPVLGVEQCRRHNGHGGQVARLRRLERPLQRQEAEAGQQNDEGVHARLGAVVHGEGCAGHAAPGSSRRRPGHRSAGRTARPPAR